MNPWAHLIGYVTNQPDPEPQPDNEQPPLFPNHQPTRQPKQNQPPLFPPKT